MSAGPVPLSPLAAPPGGTGDFLSPVLSTLIDAVKRGAARVGRTSVASKGDGGASDPEAIHDFRVALRRLRTVLRPARRPYGERRLRAVGDELRRFAQATGTLRDEEVLRETLEALELSAKVRTELGAWLVQRARQERARRRQVGVLIAAIDPLAAGGQPLGEALARLERRLGRRHPDEPAGALAEAALAEATAGVAALLDARPSDGPGMHALRIRYKRLRYIAELFAPLLGERAAVVGKDAARMQKRLGELHDIDEALTRIGRARSLSHAARSAVGRALHQARTRMSARIHDDLMAERARLGGECSLE